MTESTPSVTLPVIVRTFLPQIIRYASSSAGTVGPLLLLYAGARGQLPPALSNILCLPTPRVRLSGLEKDAALKALAELASKGEPNIQEVRDRVSRASGIVAKGRGEHGEENLFNDLEELLDPLAEQLVYERRVDWVKDLKMPLTNLVAQLKTIPSAQRPANFDKLMKALETISKKLSGTAVTWDKQHNTKQSPTKTVNGWIAPAMALYFLLYTDHFFKTPELDLDGEPAAQGRGLLNFGQELFDLCYWLHASMGIPAANINGTEIKTMIAELGESEITAAVITKWRGKAEEWAAAYTIAAGKLKPPSSGDTPVTWAEWLGVNGKGDDWTTVDALAQKVGQVTAEEVKALTTFRDSLHHPVSQTSNTSKFALVTGLVLTTLGVVGHFAKPQE